MGKSCKGVWNFCPLDACISQSGIQTPCCLSKDLKKLKNVHGSQGVQVQTSRSSRVSKICHCSDVSEMFQQCHAERLQIPAKVCLQESNQLDHEPCTKLSSSHFNFHPIDIMTALRTDSWRPFGVCHPMTPILFASLMLCSSSSIKINCRRGTLNC